MNSLKPIALFAACVTASAIAAASPEARQTLYQESRTTTTTDNRTQTVTRKVWIKHPGKVRMEESLGPQSRISVSNGVDFWIAVPSQKKGIHRKLTPQQSALLAKQLNVDLDQVPKFVKAGAKKVRQERVNGVLCDVYQRSQKDQLTVTLWVAASGQRLAQRQEESGVIRAAAQAGQPMRSHILKSTTDYLKWQIDRPIADSEFVPPAGIKYEDINAAPGPAGAKPKKH